MKICWDTLDNLRYSKRKESFVDITRPTRYYVYIEFCKKCGEAFLANKRSSRREYCSYLCSNGKGHRYWDGKHLSEKHKKTLSSLLSKEGNPRWKGGVTLKKLPLFDTYAPQLEWCESVRRDLWDEKILNVKCTYCGKWYTPTIQNVRHRLLALKKIIGGGNGLYCSTECKHLCPIFGMHKNYKFQVGDYTRESQSELRQLVFERDNWACTKCSSTYKLHCHHIEGIRWEPLESADIDKCITVCEKCHKEIHKKEECKTLDMQCKNKVEET